MLVLPPEKVMLFLVKFLKREEQASFPASVTLSGEAIPGPLWWNHKTSGLG